MPEKLKVAKMSAQTTAEDVGKLQVIQAQNEWIKRLEADMDDKAALLKQAKMRVEEALGDLRKLCDPSVQQQGELFAGELLLDPNTGLIRGYRSIGEIEREIQEAEDAKRRERERKLRASDA